MSVYSRVARDKIHNALLAVSSTCLASTNIVNPAPADCSEYHQAQSTPPPLLGLETSASRLPEQSASNAIFRTEDDIQQPSKEQPMHCTGPLARSRSDGQKPSSMMQDLLVPSRQREPYIYPHTQVQPQSPALSTIPPHIEQELPSGQATFPPPQGTAGILQKCIAPKTTVSVETFRTIGPTNPPTSQRST